MFDVLVIGGGPSGMMAAIFAARAGTKVCLVEKNERLGMKILASGNGRCNVSNRFISKSRYHGSFQIYVQEIFDEFDATDTVSFYEDLGVELKEEDRGRYFPVTDKAQTIVTALLVEMDSQGVEVRSGVTVRDLRRNNEYWEAVLTNNSIIAKTVIVTTGGKAAHKLGSSGDGLFWAQKLGHKPTPLFAALVAMETKEIYVKAIMGVKLSVSAAALVDNDIVREQTGEMLFTHYGVSGPAVMGLSGALAPFVGVKRTEIRLNMFPGETNEELTAWLLKEIQANPKKKLATILDNRLPQKIARLIPELLSLDQKNASEISKKDRAMIVNYFTSFPLTIAKIRPLKEAQVTSGGIPVCEVTTGLASKKNKGLFFAGEILDIDGDSGGFNLQWAWSSGVVAGKAAAESVK